MRNQYRQKFKLTAAEMDDEPLNEVNMHFAIWKAEGLRQKKEEKKNQPSKLKNAQ